VVEVKAVNLEKVKSFSFAEITPEQRRWLGAWAEGGGLGYLAIGTLGERPRRLWVIDWLEWLQIEERVSASQKSISVDGGQRHISKEHNIGILCSPWELWRVAGGWEFPEGHTLSKIGVDNDRVAE
jgi:hypothetical protein